MCVSDFDLIIVPRLGGAGEEDWPSRWRAKLMTARFAAPDDLNEPRREAWIEALAAAARAADRPALIIGHRLGAAAVIHAAEALAAADVRGAFLVALPDEAGLSRLAGPDWVLARAALSWWRAATIPAAPLTPSPPSLTHGARS